MKYLKPKQKYGRPIERYHQLESLVQEIRFLSYGIRCWRDLVSVRSDTYGNVLPAITEKWLELS